MIKLIYRFLIGFSESKYRKKINHLISLLNIKNGISLIDIGAAGQIIPRWERVEKFINYYGFEPDERSRKKLLAQRNNCRSYHLDEKIISNKKEKKIIHFCKAPMTSSIYQPNRDYVDLFADADRFDIISQELLDSTTIDKINCPKKDFIKLDIQGGELEALKGGKDSLKKCLGLEVEVEFLPIYKDQPLYTDVTKFLKDNDFEFIDFLRICRWERNNIYTNLGQAAWGDALYLKTPEFIVKNITDTDLIKRYIAICIIYNKIDLVKCLLKKLNSNTIILDTNFIKKLNGFHKRLTRSKLIKEKLNKFLKLFLFVDEEIHMFN